MTCLALTRRPLVENDFCSAYLLGQRVTLSAGDLCVNSLKRISRINLMPECGRLPSRRLVALGAIRRTHPGQKLSAVNVLVASRATDRSGAEGDLVRARFEPGPIVASLAGQSSVGALQGKCSGRMIEPGDVLPAARAMAYVAGMALHSLRKLPRVLVGMAHAARYFLEMETDRL